MEEQLEDCWALPPTQLQQQVRARAYRHACRLRATRVCSSARGLPDSRLQQLHLAITTHGQMHSTGPPKHISNSSNKHQTTKRPQADILCAVDETRGDLIATCRHCASFVASCQVRTPRPLPAQRP